MKEVAGVVGKATLKMIQELHTGGHLAADFKLFGVPQTEEEAAEWVFNYQKIRNQVFQMAQDLFTTYEEDVQRTTNPELTEKENLVEAALGLASEAGEAAGVIKKWATQGHDLDTVAVIGEAGDTLYYLARMLKHVGSSIPEAMRVNMQKRQERYPNGFDPERSRNRGRV